MATAQSIAPAIATRGAGADARRRPRSVEGRPDGCFAGERAVCVMDAGNNGVLILADHMLPPRKHGVLIPGPQNHAMKLAFEKYFIWKMKHGQVGLP